jgi:hypothetical protein
LPLRSSTALRFASVRMCEQRSVARETCITSISDHGEVRLPEPPVWVMCLLALVFMVPRPLQTK